MANLWFEHALLPEGWRRGVRLSIADGRIARLRTGCARAAEDEAYALGLPGLPNVHSHAFQRAAAARTGVRGDASDSFWTWRAQMYGLAGRLTPEGVGAIAALAYAEMLEAGFTRVGEFHYLHHDPGGRAYDNPAEMALQHLAAAEAAGIDITLLPVFYAHADVGGLPPRPDQARFVCSLDGFADLFEHCAAAIKDMAGARLGVAPHSLRAATATELQAVLTLAPLGPIHIHIAEQVAEVDRCEAVLGARPVEWLLANVDVDHRWCLVHATHMTPPETLGLAATGAVAGLCPITEADLGDGVFPAAQYLRAGGRFAIGSDSNVFIDPPAELRLLEYGQRLAARERNVIAAAGASVGRTLFEGCLAGGRQALAGDETGLRPGGPATLVALQLGDVAFAECEGDALLDAWIFAARRPAVDAVWRRGRKVVVGGRHVARASIDAAYRKALAHAYR